MNTTIAKRRNSYLLFISILMLTWLFAGSAGDDGDHKIDLLPGS